MELVLFLILSIRQCNYTTFTEGLLSFILNALRAIPEKCIILSSRKNKHMVNDIFLQVSNSACSRSCCRWNSTDNRQCFKTAEGDSSVLPCMKSMLQAHARTPSVRRLHYRWTCNALIAPYIAQTLQEALVGDYIHMMKSM